MLEHRIRIILDSIKICRSDLFRNEGEAPRRAVTSPFEAPTLTVSSKAERRASDSKRRLRDRKKRLRGRESEPWLAHSAPCDHELVQPALDIDFASGVRQERPTVSQTAEERVSHDSGSAA